MNTSKIIKCWTKSKSTNITCSTLKNPDNAIVGNESMFILTILEKIKETSLKPSQGSNSIINNSKLSRSESQTNKYTIKQIKICSKK